MIVVRSDSSREIGTGHIVRDLSLAASLKELGHTVHFVCRDLPGNISALIQEKGFACTLLAADASMAQEQATIRSLKPDWIIVDHYGLDAEWEKAFQSLCPIFVIDDLANRKHQCQVLLDTNYSSKPEAKYANLLPPDCSVYVGPHFSLLRQSILPLKKTKAPNPRPQILCFFGGADGTGEAWKLAQALEQQKTKSFFQIVVMKSHPNLKELQSLPVQDHFQILVAPANWDQLMADADLYFGSGGTVTWERLYLGLPGVVVSVADNQVEIAKDLAQSGLQFYWGRAGEKEYSKCIQDLDQIVQQKSDLARMAEAGQKTVRPLPKEILQSIFGPADSTGFLVQRATLDDARFLHELRNDPLTRQMSKNQDLVPWDQHINWLTKKLQDSHSRLYVGWMQGQRCGQFRVDANGVTSVAIASDFRGKGLAARLIENGCRLYFEEFPSCHELFADIKPDNVGSVKNFERAGFVKLKDKQEDSETYSVFHLLRMKN